MKRSIIYEGNDIRGLIKHDIEKRLNLQSSRFDINYTYSYIDKDIKAICELVIGRASEETRKTIKDYLEGLKKEQLCECCFKNPALPDSDRCEECKVVTKEGRLTLHLEAVKTHIEYLLEILKK